MITVFGSVNLDLIGQVSRIPSPGETVPGGAFSTAAGGKGANQALAARRAGAAVRMVGALGNDAFAAEALALLAADGVDLGALRRVEGPTGIAMIFVDGAGENVIAVLPGANGTVSAADADAAIGALAAGDIVMVQQEVPQAATARALEIAAARRATTILNTAPFLADTGAMAARASIAIANETEFALMTGAGLDRLEPAMAEWARATGRTIIVTLGADGARAATPTEAFAVPALKVDPIDTVGAGDTFCGYLAAGLSAGLSLREAMARAAVAASLACLKPGAQPAIPWADEVAAALKV